MTTTDVSTAGREPHAFVARGSPPTSSSPVGAPRLLICRLTSDAAPADDDPVGAMAQGGWPHPRVGACYVELPADSQDAFAALSADLRATGADGVLLVDDQADADAIEVEIFARNLAPRRRGQPSARITPTGPASARATAPAAELMRALAEEGLTAVICSGERDCGGRSGRGNYLLYRLLTEVAGAVGAPTVGLLRLPATAQPGGGASLRALRAAAIAFADTLSPVQVRS